MLSRPVRWGLRQLGDLTLGLAVTVALFLVAEGVVRLGGWGAAGVAPPRHLTAGFDPAVRVLEPDPDVPGGWRGRFSHDRSEELRIGPKRDAPRVLLFGGSNTARLPARVLAEELQALAGRPIEVVNLGRPGYGSTRVAILFREALERLEPDAVVLYSGHNEFVEKSFAMDVAETWSNPVARLLARGLEATRTGRLLERAVAEPPPRGERYARLADWDAEYQKFADLGWAETQAVWDAYEENLRYMAGLAGEAGVPMLLATPVWNRLSAPRIDTPRPDVAPAAVARARRGLQRARALYPEPLRALLPRRDRDRVHSFDWGRGRDELPEGEQEAPPPGLRPAHGWLAGRDGELPRDRRWAPRVRAWYEALAWLQGPRSDEERGALEEAAAALDGALAARPDSPRARYERALVRFALGERGEALGREFDEAARRDRAPRKATPESNDRVRAVAADLDHVRLDDADARFRAACPDGLVGWEWMVDHCHLSPGGAAALCESWAPMLLELLEVDG